MSNGNSLCNFVNKDYIFIRKYKNISQPRHDAEQSHFITNTIVAIESYKKIEFSF